MNEFLSTNTTITTTTTTLQPNATNTTTYNVPHKYNENQKSLNDKSSSNMLNKRKWRPHRTMTAPTPSPSYNRLHYTRPSTHLPQYHGILKWFNIQQQYGFIEYQEKDVFVHESAFINLKMHQIQNIIGESLTFNIADYFDRKTGKYKQKAINVKYKTPSNTSNTLILPSKPCNNIPWSKACNNNDKKAIKGPIKKQTNGTKHQGTLLWFNEHSKFGFIRCDNDMKDTENEDLFVYESELLFDRQLLHKGMRVQFDIEIYRDYHCTERKKAIAVDILDNNTQNRMFSGQKYRLNPDKHKLVNNGPPPNHSRLHYSSYSRSSYLNCNKLPKYKGSLLWFNDEKKHGFIECDDESMMDVFVYETDFIFPKYIIEKDMRLLFDIKVYNDYNNKQRQKAINVIIDTEYNKTNTQHKAIAKPRFNVDAEEFVPQCLSTKTKIILDPIMEEEDEYIEIKEKITKKKKKKKKKKYGINVERLFKDNTDYRVIAKRLFQVFIGNNMDYDVKDVFNKLYGLHKSYRTEMFLSVNLEFISLIEEDKSILNVIDHINKYKEMIIDGYFGKLLCIKSAASEFKDYGLKCIYPSPNMGLIRNLIVKECDIGEFINNKCYVLANYSAQYSMLDYLIPKYCNDDALFCFIKLMVSAQDIADCDNNDKLLLLSIVISIFNKYNLFQTHLLSFIKRLLQKDIIGFDVIEKWRLDEFDTITKGKKKALIVLSDLIHELQNKEIKDDDDRDYHDIDDDDNDCLKGAYLCGYIGTDDLLQINMNRHVSNRCLWRQITSHTFI